MWRSCKNIFHFFVALLANIYYRFPGKKMVVIGLTATSGKTTTTHLVYHLLKSAGKRVSMISSVWADINGKTYDTGFHVTTPSDFALQKLLSEAVKGGSKYFVMEVSSHALDQCRVWGSSIDIAIVTNLSHEHLDYHGTLQNYWRSKAKILKGAKYAILNKDDQSFSFLKKRVSRKTKLVTFSLKQDADYTLKKVKFKTQLFGEYNLYNSLAAATVAKIIGIEDRVISEALANFAGIKGRMEEIKTGKDFRVFIDFAHKPNALESVLNASRKLTENKLIIIFGSAGLRDRLKRGMMGEIAARLADYVILTAEDPRTEDVRIIIDQIASGCLRAKIKGGEKGKNFINQINAGGKYFWRIPDRQEAINFAIKKLARKGDVVIAAGKGHEQSMCYGKTEYPWDEKKAILKALYGSV